MTILVDSDVLIEVSRGRDAGIVHAWTQLAGSSDAILCSPVSVAELWHGALPKEHQLLTKLFASLVCVTIGSETGRLAGEYLRRFAKSHGVELGDALIAASATEHQATLWTRNRKHYPMKGLAFY